jgi:thiamine-monophosphate kinase
MARASEDDLIARYFAPLAGAAGLGLRDDAALFTPPSGCDLVLTKDALVAGVHFFAEDPPHAIAAKALRVNLSDLAAKGARPQGFLLALALPRDWREDWLAAFAQGLGADSRGFGCPLWGGDTVATPGPLTISITAIGACAAGRMVARTGAQPGDFLYVSGTIGDSALGLALRLGQAQAPDPAPLLERYLLPQPRLGLAEGLAAHAHGAMDVSDGLVGDLAKMMRASGCGAAVDAQSVPLSAAARAMVGRDGRLFKRALTGGDDYEILCSVPPGATQAFEQAARAASIPVARIGVVTGGADVVWTDGQGEALADFGRGSFSHF